jgi:hypothetical protein
MQTDDQSAVLEDARICSRYLKKFHYSDDSLLAFAYAFKDKIIAIQGSI